ncbi:MAG: hypothetical protein ABEJ35_07835 [Halobacteriaceae archaeon]
MADPVIVGLVGVAGLLVVWRLADEVRAYRRRRAHVRERAWYEDAIRYCERPLAVLEAHDPTEPGGTDGPDAEQVRSEMAAAVERFSQHAGEAVGRGVDDEAVAALREASQACRRLSEARIEIGDTEEWRQAVSEARSALTAAKATAEQRT